MKAPLFPVGTRVTFNSGFAGDEPTPCEVIGVIADGKGPFGYKVRSLVALPFAETSTFSAFESELAAHD